MSLNARYTESYAALQDLRQPQCKEKELCLGELLTPC